MVDILFQFYGAPENMQNIAKSLLEAHGPEKLHILVAKSNSGSFTSDGIDRGAERLCTEIEEELGQISSRGGKVTKFSMIGFSLGGLIARYALGLLHANGFLDTVECMVSGQVDLPTLSLGRLYLFYSFPHIYPYSISMPCANYQSLSSHS